MTQSVAGQPALELAVPYWIDAEGKERPPLTPKELGARHRLLFLPALVRWLLPSLLTEWSFRMDSPSTSIGLSERSLKTDQLSGDVCDACALSPIS
jgi:hypothetical protein